VILLLCRLRDRSLLVLPTTGTAATAIVNFRNAPGLGFMYLYAIMMWATKAEPNLNYKTRSPGTLKQNQKKIRNKELRFSFCVCGMRKDLISFVSEKKWQIDAKTYGDGRKCWWSSVVLVMLSVARMCDFQFTSSSWQMIGWRPAAKPSQRPAKALAHQTPLPPSGHNVTMWSDPCLLILKKRERKEKEKSFWFVLIFFTNNFCLNF
jgi:hypothetical protein